MVNNPKLPLGVVPRGETEQSSYRLYCTGLWLCQEIPDNHLDPVHYVIAREDGKYIISTIKEKKYIMSWKVISAKGNRRSKTRQGTQELKFRNKIIGRSLIEEMAFEFPSSSVLTLSSDSAMITLFRRGGEDGNQEPLPLTFEKSASASQHMS